MNVKRFTARTSRDALGLVKQTFGQDAVVLSTRPCPEGVEILAMAPDAVAAYDATASSPLLMATPAAATAATTAAQDAERLAMSTLSFQDYVRERMLRRRRAELTGETAGAAGAANAAAVSSGVGAAPSPVVPPMAAPSRMATGAAGPDAYLAQPEAARARAADPLSQHPAQARHAPAHYDPEGLGAFANKIETVPVLSSADAAALQRDQSEMLSQLREVKSLIEQRFGTLAFMEKLQRDPRQARLCLRLLDVGFSPKLIRRLSDGLPAEVDELTWVASVLERNLSTGEREPALEDAGGVFALIGATGVGKTTSTAKLAAAFAARHGAGNLGLITLDAYRVGAHEQLRAYGRILGVPVHTAHDRASLEDLLDLLSAKKMVLIDTAGMAQRDERTQELLGMLNHRAVQHLLVVNAAVQGETVDDVISAYRAAQCRGVVLSKIDEAVKLAPVLDSLVRQKLKVLAVANGQRVPEDWHRLSAATLVQRALNASPQAAWKREADDVSLAFAGARLTAPGGLTS